MEIVIGIVLLVTAVFLAIAVLMQSGKSHNLSGSIAGGAETFFGKTKGKAIDKMLSKITTVVAIAFAVLVIIVYIIQPDEYVDTNKYFKDNFESKVSAEDTNTASDAETAGDEGIFEDTDSAPSEDTTE